MSVLNENTIIGASGAGGDYEIEQSLRFDDGRGTYLSRTFPSAGNRKTWTYSLWFKRGNLGGGEVNIFKCYTASNDNDTLQVRFDGSDQLNIGAQTVSYGKPTQVFRDTSAWYHLVIALDTTQGTADNRVKVYVNGQQVTSFSAKSNPSQNADLAINQAAEHVIGSSRTYSNMFDGYMGEVNFIDGQALTPDSFGETGTYGEWKPIAYAGTYGTNGFYLPFEQDYTVEGFSTVTYEGASTDLYVGGTGFKPDLVWVKRRNASAEHQLIDSVRGNRKLLSSDTTGAELDRSYFKSFDNDGFSVETNVSNLNLNGSTYVAWNWDMGGTTASNTNGSITSSVRANTAYGQSIVSYTGNGNSNVSIGHGLGQIPDIVIIKPRGRDDNWVVSGQYIGAEHDYIYLNATGAAGGAANTRIPNADANNINLGTFWNNINTSGIAHIAYCFSSVTGYSKIGSYSGNGSTTGPVVTLGFSPAFVMIKRTDAAEQWRIFDNTRNPTNPVTRTLNANESNAESDNANNTLNFTSTGFQLTATNGGTNASGGTYIYMAFADTREYAYWYDQSGNNNDWTSEGGLTESDVMVDSPTNNFCTLNPLALGADGTLSEGSLKIVYGTSSTRASTTATIGTASDKRYWEVTMVTNGAEVIGISDSPTPLGLYTGQVAGGWGYYGDDGSKYVEGTNSAYGASYTTGDIIGFALDMDAGTLVCYKNNATQGTLASGLTGDMYPSIGDGGGTSTTSNVFNFGQDSSFAGNKAAQGNQDANGIGDFYYAPPTGFLALCTANLPEPDVIPSENFNTVLYTGNGSTQSITGVGFGSAPDLVWAKQRNGANPHEIADIVRGVNNTMGSSGTGADYNNTTYQYNSFDTDGFTVTDDAAGNYAINGSGKTYVAWNWKAGGSASSNSNGTITSSVSANPSAGFSIVSYTGTGSNATVGHGLTLAAPEMVIVKSRDTANSWNTWHEALPATNYVVLNSTQAAQAYAPLWNSTAPTSSVFSLGTDQGGNKSSDAFIAYAFHSVDGYSKVGSYTGNGSADGPFVHCGFKVAMIIQKRTDGADSWHILDNKRSPSNVVDDRLYPNSSSAESTSGDRVDFTSNGFKVRTTNGDFNASGGTYIFIAFAESPFKHSNAR